MEMLLVDTEVFTPLLYDKTSAHKKKDEIKLIFTVNFSSTRFYQNERIIDGGWNIDGWENCLKIFFITFFFVCSFSTSPINFNFVPHTYRITALQFECYTQLKGFKDEQLAEWKVG